MSTIWDTFNICCNYGIITLILNYILISILNMTFKFELHEFEGDHVETEN
jgi:hypothetical protein